eukprot:scaffold41893_cov35-Phaeocystis_antarctica.AAC.1
MSPFITRPVSFNNVVDVLHVDQAPPPLWSRHSPSNGPCVTRSWTNIGLLACRRVVCDTCVLPWVYSNHRLPQ